MTDFKKERIDYKLNSVKIAEVIFNHDYFINGLFSRFDINPTKRSKDILKNHNIIFKRSNYGFVLIFHPEERFFSPVFSNEINIDLKFEIKDSKFMSYTNIPFDNNLFFSFENNYNSNYLHQSEFVESNNINLSTENGLKGSISLLINKNNEIFGGKDLKLINNSYKINFCSREVYFRYNFYKTDVNEINFNNFYLTNEEKTIKINNFKRRTLENGLKVVSVIFEKSTKIKEKYSNPFFLVKEDDLFNKTSIFLPYPEPKNITYEEVNKRFINEAFVKLLS